MISMMNVDVCHDEPSNQTPSLLTIPITVIPETPTATATTIPLPIPPFIPPPHQSTPTPTLTPTLTPILTTTTIPKEAQAEKERYIDLIERLVKDIINDEVKTQLPQIIPKAVSDFTTHVIKSTVIESLKDVVLAKSSSQPKSTYEAGPSLTEFELKKIPIDKREKSQSNLTADEHKELNKALVNSYNIDKDLFLVYGKVVSLKRGREDKDKDEDPPTGSDQGMKRRKTRNDAESSKRSKSKESKSTSSSNGTTCSQPKPSNKSAQAEEQIHIVHDTKVQLNQGQDMGNIDDYPNVEAALKHDWIKKPERPPSLDSDWNYLRGGGSSKKYTTSTTKTKAAKYDIQGIEDIVPWLWSPVKERDVIFDLGVALRMFTRRIILLKWVEDLQLGVERYQKKLNITKPETFRSDISNKIPYIAYNNPQGIIYEDKYKRNRLMRTDELYKFSDGTLTSVRSVLYDIALNLRMDYLPKRRWSSLDRKRSRIMIKAINQLLLERRLMRSLEKFIGGRDYGEDPRLLQRTI
ncbi:hypothetical protein Tco_0313191 [Tanacetum coccineum]